MPVHDWTLVDAGIFHAFHGNWIAEIGKSLNGGLLPKGFYALPEQHFGHSVADVLTLHTGTSDSGSPSGSGVAMLDAPPTVRRRVSVDQGLRARRRSLAIRHVSGHRLVALLEILSPATNKDRISTIQQFSAKVIEAIDFGIHVLVIDVFPPGPNDPQGIHGAIHGDMDENEPPYDLPPDEPLTLASYTVDQKVEIYIEHMAVGGSFPDIPLFIGPKRWIKPPLESTYHEAYRGMPEFWRNVLEGKPNS